ncbi:MAG: hypothetical protein R6U68_15630 [Desulfobacteraceae bacterium]
MILNFLDLQAALKSPDLKGNEPISGQGAVQGSLGGETFFASQLQKEMAKGIASDNAEKVLTRIKNTQKDQVSVDALVEMLKSSSKTTSPLEDLLQKFVSNQEDALQLDKSLGRFFSFFIQNLEHAEGQDFLDQFKRCLEMLGVDIEDISVDEQGLDILKHLLVKAGFPEKEISDLIEELQFESEDSFVALSDLMTELSKIMKQ